jgi:DNA-binding winged helix-turn-helix (wHTH) protein
MNSVARTFDTPATSSATALLPGSPKDHPLRSMVLESKRLGAREWFVIHAESPSRTSLTDDSLGDLRVPLIVPIVVVASSAEERDRIVGGLTEYIKGVQRQRADPQPIVEAGELRVDRAARRVAVEGEEVTLTNLEFHLLVTLLERRERVQSRATLLCDVWGVHGQARTRTVDTHVKRLRDKLRSAGRFIQSVRGVGYRFSEMPLPQEGDASWAYASVGRPQPVHVALRPPVR